MVLRVVRERREGVTLQEFIASRQAEGLSLTAAVALVCAVTAASPRAVWIWVKGERPVPETHRRLLQVWSDCNPDQRRRWFPEP